MKRTLILVLILLLLVMAVFMLFKSVNIGKLQILGIKDLNEEIKNLMQVSKHYQD